MKVIDLLNKIANGEEVPNKIKYEDMIFEYENGDYYIDVEEGNGNIGTYVMLEHLRFNKDYDNKEALQLEVEEVEETEDKKIILDKLNWDKNDMKYITGEIDNESVIDIILDMQSTINEIINYLEEKSNE